MLETEQITEVFSDPLEARTTGELEKKLQTHALLVKTAVIIGVLNLGLKLPDLYAWIQGPGTEYSSPTTLVMCTKMKEERDYVICKKEYTKQ